MPTLSRILFAMLALVMVAPLEASAQKTSRRPNIIVILTDDQGWGDLSMNGNTNLSTPNIDGLAKAGASFDRFYVCPVCSPTRAEFLTGRYHPRGGVFSTSTGGERLDLDEKTIAEFLRALGYMTAAFGKWHNGMQYPYHPNGRGFDEYYGFCSGHWGNYFSPMLEHNGKIVKGKGFLADDLTDKAISFMRRNKDRPFFAYVPYNIPHSPMQVPDRFWQKFANKKLAMRHREPNKEDVPHTRAALAMCENIDWNVGRILQALKDLDLEQETIVVYFCDNGPNGWRWNGGMKGRKGSTDEGGVRSPLLIRWPGKIPAGKTVPQIAAAIDLLPTLAELADVPLKTPNKLDGKSLAPLLLGKNPARWPDRMIFSHWAGRVSVRTQQYRLDHQGKLFDMQADPGQKVDVSAKLPAQARRLRAAVAAWRKDVLTGFKDKDRPFLIGSKAFRYTQMPARDATTTGGIQRSNRHPNCTYFTHWTSPKDTIVWDAEVAADGLYQVEVYYTCPKKDVGSTFELRFGDSKVAGKIAEPHDPPLVGAADDRVERGEGYVKDFKALNIGSIRLKRGRGQLVLQATEVPGSQVMDFRLLMFTRIDK